MSGSDEVLKALLEVEKEAARIVEAAQKEADNDINEAARRVRADYDEKYIQMTVALDAEREASLAELQKNYDNELALYKKQLDAQTLNTEAFNALGRKIIFQTAGGGRKDGV